MRIYNTVIVDQIGRFLAMSICAIGCIMMMVMGLEQLAYVPEGISIFRIAQYLAIESVHIACWVLPTGLYVALVLWTMHAMESQLAYRIFHAGFSRRYIYCLQLVWIFPLFILTVMLNFYYLPIARVAQKILIEHVYQNDMTSYIGNNRFHTFSVADEKWVMYLHKHQKKTQLYAFKKHDVDDFSVMYAPSIYTDRAHKQLVLENGARVDFRKKKSWPIELWTFGQYAMNVSIPQLVGDGEKANYDIVVWVKKDMDNRLELYNRMGRVGMLVILSIIPLMLLEPAPSKQRLYTVQYALAWYVFYWFCFILCRWLLMWDNFQHLVLLFTPHSMMAACVGWYYWMYVRKV